MLAEILRLSYPQDLLRYNFTDTHAGWGKGGTVVTYVLSFWECRSCNCFLHQSYISTHSFSRVSWDRWSGEGRPMEYFKERNWRRWNRCVGKMADFICFLPHSLWKTKIASGTFVWMQISDLDKKGLKKYGVNNSSCMSCISSWRWMLTLAMP